NAGWAFSTRVISRPRARGEPALACSTRAGTSTTRRDRIPETGLLWSALRPGDAHDEGVALSAAAAQRGRTDPAAATLQLQRQVQQDPRSGHADRVAERDRAAVDVDLVRVQAQLLGRRQTDGREGLVDLDQVQVAGL